MIWRTWHRDCVCLAVFVLCFAYQPILLMIMIIYIAFIIVGVVWLCWLSFAVLFLIERYYY